MRKIRKTDIKQNEDYIIQQLKSIGVVLKHGKPNLTKKNASTIIGKKQKLIIK